MPFVADRAEDSSCTSMDVALSLLDFLIVMSLIILYLHIQI